MTPGSVKKAVLTLLQRQFPSHRVEDVPGGIAVYDPEYPDNVHHAVLISFASGHSVIEAEKAQRRSKRKAYARKK